MSGRGQGAMRSAEAVPWGTNRLYPERDRPSDMPKTHLPVAKPFYGPEEEQAVSTPGTEAA